MGTSGGVADGAGRTGLGTASDSVSETKESAARAAAGPKQEARAVQLRDDFDPSLLPFVLPDPPRSSRLSCNGREAETVATLRCKAMPEAYTSRVTAHTPVLWYLEAQRARARAAGVDLDSITAAGPSPYLEFHSVGYQGPAAPVSSADMVIDETDWDGILAWFAAYCSVDRTVIGVAVTGITVTGIAVTGIAVTGIALTSIAATGIAVTGMPIVTGPHIRRHWLNNRDWGAEPVGIRV